MLRSPGRCSRHRGHGARRGGRCYLILAKHSFWRSSSKRTCDSMAVSSAAVPLLENSAEAFLSRFCFQSRIASLVAFWASDAALKYVFMQASAIVKWTPDLGPWIAEVKV